MAGAVLQNQVRNQFPVRAVEPKVQGDIDSAVWGFRPLNYTVCTYSRRAKASSRVRKFVGLASMDEIVAVRTSSVRLHMSWTQHGNNICWAHLSATEPLMDCTLMHRVCNLIST